jgi:DNA-binding transcriptional MerR regulator
MKTYTVKQISDLLKIPKDTLIYYDKFGLVVPKRGDNGYRYYTIHDIRELKYVEVCKYNNFTLKEIKQSLDIQRPPTIEGFQWHREYIREKKEQLREQQKNIQSMIDLLDVAEGLMEQKFRSGSHDTSILQGLIDETFMNIRRKT